jgi:transposase
MEVLHPRCAGLDVPKDSVVACGRLAEGGRVERHVETFATTTADLERLSAWLAGYGVTHVAMEATGVYWKPVWAVLCEADRVLVLANAQHVKAVPGRKTDVNDATWLADLLAHGLIRPSFVPPMEVQALRDLTRTRKQLTRERASHVQRIDKLLQAANLKLGSVLSDIMGQSGRVVLDALAARTIQASSPTSCARGCGPRARSLSRRFGAGSRRTGAGCCACISSKRIVSMQPSPRSTRRSRRGSSPFATPSRG